MPRHAHGHAHAPEPLLAASESARHLPASSSQQPAAARIDTALGPRPLIHERFVCGRSTSDQTQRARRRRAPPSRFSTQAALARRIPRCRREDRKKAQ